jgi:hypothetical protein
MIWIILAALGVPIWLCALAVLSLVIRNRGLRKRAGDVPVRRRTPGRTRWTRGHGIWVHDVFAFRGSPAMWSETLTWVTEASTRRVAGAEEAKKLRRLGEHPAIVVMKADDGSTVELAAPEGRALDLLGPFAVDAAGPRTLTDRP